MFKSFKSLALLSLLSLDIALSHPNFEISLVPSHDAFIRRDKTGGSYGKSSKITVTKAGSNQRIGLMKFETSKYPVNSRDNKFKLRLGIAESHETKPVEVKVVRLVEDFHEDHISWETFDGNVEENEIKFSVETHDRETYSDVDVTMLMREGEDTILAFLVEKEGHVKFYSKDGSNNDKMLSPRLIINMRDEL
mmetsp:Transcript_25842/g.31862  ORF Transcript_25842/g.31862 Transcript_25842/m.31862 type:complete len:193 (-) Transcript_25842:238-816(-)